jgi:hypothetical protein
LPAGGGTVRQAEGIARVYNIEVDEFDTYFVEPLCVWGGS